MNNFTERKPFVSYLSKNEIRFAEQFASKHGLELITPRNLRISKTHKQVIWVSAKNLALQDLAIKNSKPFVIDYMDFKKIMAKSSLLKKCFSKKDIGRKVIDLTAGYCIDALEIRIDFLNDDSLDLLKKYSDHEIVYLDQMFEQKNDARAKKEIQFLRNLDFEEFDLNRFKKSLKQNNFKKIIYKSALYSNMNSLINLKPSRVIKGKAFKYNIFTIDQESE